MLDHTNVGVNPNLCNPNQASQNFRALRNNDLNLQQQSGKLNQYFSKSGVPPGKDDPNITDALQDLESRVSALESATGGGGSGVSAYGSLLLTSDQDVAMATPGDLYTDLVEFDTAGPTLGITATTGASAKLEVASDGDYYISYSLQGQEEADSLVSRRLRMAAAVYINGVISELNMGVDGQYIITTGTATGGLVIAASGGGIVALSAGDDIELYYFLRASAETIELTIGAPGDIAENPPGANVRGSLQVGHLSVIKLA